MLRKCSLLDIQIKLAKMYWTQLLKPVEVIEFFQTILHFL